MNNSLSIFNFFKQIYYHGNQRYCPICNKSSRKFLNAGIMHRKDVRCPYCNSLERHRFSWLFLTNKTKILDKNNKILHIAPEKCLETKFKEIFGKNYLSADLYSHAMVKMDITNIQYPDNSFDFIYCSHVLEHVLDDKKAIKEFYRIIKKNGSAILNVPITTIKTFEDPTITDPEERLKIFGQKDHVRRYGLDYVDRLEEAGFKVQVIKNYFNEEDTIRMSLNQEIGEIYYCKK